MNKETVEQLDIVKIIKQLNKKGVSKYRIAKLMKVSWNAVDMWSRGVWQPSEGNKIKMNDLFYSKEEDSYGYKQKIEYDV